MKRNLTVACLAVFFLLMFVGFCEKARASDCQMIMWLPPYDTPACHSLGAFIFVKREVRVKWKFRSDEQLPLAAGTYYLHSRFIIKAVQVDSMGYINSEAQDDFGVPGIYIFYPEEISGSYDCNFTYLSTSPAVGADPIPGIYVSGGLTVPWSVTGGSPCGWTFMRPITNASVKISAHIECQSCQSCSSGKLHAEAGSVDIVIDAGKSRNGLEGNQLKIHAEYPTPSTYQPAGIQFNLASDTWVFREATRPGNRWPGLNDLLARTRQVLTADTLVDITATSLKSMELKFYHATDKGQLGVDGYQPTVAPVRRIIIENSGTLESENSLVKISEIEGQAEAKVKLYTWTTATQEWKLDDIDSGVSETASSVWDGNHVYRLDTYKTFSSNTPEVVVESHSKTYKEFPFGVNLVEETTGIGTDASSVQYSYYENGSYAGYGQIQSKIYSTGHWERYEYEGATAQNSGRLSKTVIQVENNTYASADSDNRVQTISYDDAQQVETEFETLKGVEISRRYRARNISLNQTKDIVCTTPGALINNLDNLVTTTTLISGGTFANETARVERPDGTITIFDYGINSNGSKTTEEKSGEPNEAKTNVVAGKKVVTIVDTAGNLQSESTYDLATNILITQKLINATDTFGRATSISYLDGTHESFFYGCCGVESQTDRMGITTNYAYNSRKLIEDETTDGITKRHLYNAAGNEISLTRQPDIDPIVIEKRGYDTAGRLNSSKDALNNETAYSELLDSSSLKVKTTTYPNLGTRIEVYNQDETLRSITGTASRPAFYEYGTWSENGEQGEFVKEYLGVDNTATEWRKTQTDMAGRVVKVIYPDVAAELSVYNGLGQLSKSIDSDGVTTLYEYDTQGEQETVAIDINGNGIIDLAGTDRITKTIINYTSTTEKITTQQYWSADDSSPTPISIRSRNLTGLFSSSTENGLTTTVLSTLGSNGSRSVKTTAPDESYFIQDYINERLIAENRYASDNTRISGVTYGYDNHRRRISATDARNGTTDYTYTVRDEIHEVTTPFPSSGEERSKTTFLYNEMGQVLSTILPDKSVTSNTWYLTGDLNTSAGSQTYLTRRAYDNQGRLETLVTASGTTAWIYDPQRGFLKAKKYEFTGENTGHGPSYTYKPSGRLLTRTNERNIVTTYGYNSAGEMISVDYNDSTTDVNLSRNRRGLPEAITDAAGTHSITWHASGQLLSDEVTSGLMGGFKLDTGYDSFSRLNSIDVSRDENKEVSQIITYDAASRIETVSSGNISAKHSYIPDSNLISSIEQKLSGITKNKLIRKYDKLNRLTQIQNLKASNSSILTSYDYAYNSLGQRKTATLDDASTWNYDYNSKGEVTNGYQNLSSGLPKEGRKYTYVYDGIGNRTSTVVNGKTATYIPNALNQYTRRTVPGFLEVSGKAEPDAEVRFNGLDVLRQGNYFWRDLAVNNNNLPVDLPVIISGIKNGVGTNGVDIFNQRSGNLFLPKTPEIFQYDVDGNLTQDGEWHYTWDGENRLIKMETITSVPSNLKQKLEFTYGWQGRRIQKKVYGWNDSEKVYVLNSDKRFVWHGWKLLAEFATSTSDNILLLASSFCLGADYSGSFDGAAGVGGIIAASFVNEPSQPCSFYQYDGNGNVVALSSAITGDLVGRYEYGPFGENLRSSGLLAKRNPFLWSSKYFDEETGFIDFGLRFYNPETGRWLNQDPIEEHGGLNINAFLGNRTQNQIDILGLQEVINSPGLLSPNSNSMPVQGIPGTLDGPPLAEPAPLPPIVGAIIPAVVITGVAAGTSVAYGEAWTNRMSMLTGQTAGATSNRRIPAAVGTGLKTRVQCKCKFMWVPARGGNKKHDDFAAALNGGVSMNMLVIAPLLGAVTYDAASPRYPYLPPSTVYEVKTGHYWLNGKNPPLNWIQDRKDQFSRQAAIAAFCGLNYQIVVDNPYGGSALQNLLPYLNITY